MTDNKINMMTGMVEAGSNKQEVMKWSGKFLLVGGVLEYRMSVTFQSGRSWGSDRT